MNTKTKATRRSKEDAEVGSDVGNLLALIA